MSRITLERLTLLNFKGCREFVLNARGENVAVYGDNATGKTTIFDAFTWLLFGKDSHNKEDFEVKPIGSNGSGIEVQVEAELKIDGQGLVLTKSLTEKWTKKRGSAEAEFTGHEIKYFVDAVPRTMRDFNKTVSDLCQEDLFILLSNPRYFNESLHWTKRREMLLTVCGDISDADVIHSDLALVALPEILGKRSLADHRAVITAERAKINEELKQLPVRIDELSRSLAEVKDEDPKTVRARISFLTTEQAAKQKELVQLQSGGAAAEKTKALREIEAEIIGARNKGQQAAWKVKEATAAKVNKLRDELAKLERSEASTMAGMNIMLSTAEGYELKLKSIREKWYAADAEKFVFEQASVCPTCGQAISEEQLAEARTKTQGEFNRAKAARLEDITTQGKETKAAAEKLGVDREAQSKALSEVQAKIEALKAEIATLEAEAPEPTAEPTEDPALAELLTRKSALESEISELAIGNHDAVAEVEQQIQDLGTKIAEQQAILAKIEAGSDAKKRIEELKKQERLLASEFERIEKELFLTEQFMRAKVRMLDERINSRFNFTRFRLFDSQINGGLKECCDTTTIYGVPYNSMNNASRINCGLEICQVLAEHHGISLLVFVDNAEAVTRLHETDAQQIRLIVSAQHPTLTIGE